MVYLHELDVRPAVECLMSLSADRVQEVTVGMQQVIRR